jgi:hypothetical protein
MNIPAFTAQASLYRTSSRYRSCGSEFSGLPSAQSVVSAYYPGPGTTHDCQSCINTCLKVFGLCSAGAAAVVGVGCLAIVTCPAAVAAATTIQEGCTVALAGCYGICNIPYVGECCPKPCGFPNPFDPGSGCCDADETCVDQNDPNSRQGCCPVGQYCGGNCCAAGESCCGDLCCPQPNHCCGGSCCEPNIPCCGDTCCSFLPPPGTPPPPPPANNCIFGGEPCMGKCCPIGTVCCGGSPGHPDCRLGSNINACLH